MKVKRLQVAEPESGVAVSRLGAVSSILGLCALLLFLHPQLLCTDLFSQAASFLNHRVADRRARGTKVINHYDLTVWKVK